jgi:hypothetical protein
METYQMVARLQSPPERQSHARPVEVERSLEQLSYLLDGVFRVPALGWRFGLDAIVGLIPGVGDTLTSLAAFYILAAGVRYRVPRVTLLRMGLNIGIDYLGGSLPIIGDVFDVWWKANQRNVELLRRRATVPANQARRGRFSDWLIVGLIILSLVALLVGSLVVAYLILSFLAARLQS